MYMLCGTSVMYRFRQHLPKATLVSTTGQSYEKAVVTEITKDNLAEDGNRYGTQEVRVADKREHKACDRFHAFLPPIKQTTSAKNAANR